MTIERPEYDNVTYPHAPWRDGFSGRAWLSRDHCIRGANLSFVEHPGECPHGGWLYVDETGADVNPHRFCSRDLNWSYSVFMQKGTTFVREAHVAPGLGTLDDLDYSGVLRTIAERQRALEASIHYPTQLAIRAQIAELEQQAVAVSQANATSRTALP